jgi:ribosomal protein S18 acetylase RimI-like enzyme
MLEGVSFRIIQLSSLEYPEYLALREEVLRRPIGLRITEEELAMEKHYVHIAGLLNGQVCATTALVREDGNKIRMIQVAIRPDVQSRGLGSAMMSFIDDYCKQHTVTYIWCHARETAISFYAKNGYSTGGESFTKVGIAHRLMYKSLAD